jgi:hypothetical protein
MSLADACLVRLSEIHPTGEIFTLDSDFRVYRRHGNRVIPVLMPGEQDLSPCQERYAGPGLGIESDER